MQKITQDKFRKYLLNVWIGKSYLYDLLYSFLVQWMFLIQVVANGVQNLGVHSRLVANLLKALAVSIQVDSGHSVNLQKHT